MFLKIPIKITW